MAEYTDRELVAIAAGREIRDGDLVVVGMQLPLLAFAFARRSHAPGQGVKAVTAATGWDLHVADDCRATSTPTGAELEIVRACDPAGFWTP